MMPKFILAIWNYKDNNGRMKKSKIHSVLAAVALLLNEGKKKHEAKDAHTGATNSWRHYV